MRIHITGNAGAGKTTLAKALGRDLNTPVFHLDELIWRPGWQKAAQDEREPLERAWIKQPDWIIEGVSKQVRDAADIVVFLDVPRPVCAWRSIRRAFRLMFRSRPEMPDGCPEITVLPTVLKIIWRFPSINRDQIYRELAGSSRLIVIRRPNELSESFPAAQAIRHTGS